MAVKNEWKMPQPPNDAGCEGCPPESQSCEFAKQQSAPPKFLAEARQAVDGKPGDRPAKQDQDKWMHGQLGGGPGECRHLVLRKILSEELEKTCLGQVSGEPYAREE